MLNLNAQQSSNIANVQTLKRRATKATIALDKVVTLEKAFGFTITSNLKLAQSQDGTIAYLAGCVIVLYDTKTFKQDFIISPARKTLTTLCFSSDGRLIATGESGHDPKVRIWDAKEKLQLVEFSGHKFLIECVIFSPNINSNLIISIGSVHDMVVNVWNFKTKFKVASNKIACKIKGISFSKDGTYFVTVGNRHVKFWYLSVSTLLETVPLKGRAAILCEMKNSSFCDVACGGGHECSQLTFAITSNGVLCEFDENRQLIKVIELRVDKAYSIFADDYNLYIGCSSGTILIFRQNNLDFIASLPRPHNLGVDISKGLDTRHLIENLNKIDLKYPDCIALSYNIFDNYLCSIYNDHSLYIWDIKDVNKVKKVDSHLFHSSSVWGLDIFSSNQFSLNSPSSYIPNDSFITCSSDNTLRIWSLDNLNSDKSNNIYSKELANIIYIDNDLSVLCDTESILSSAIHENNENNLPQQQTINNEIQQNKMGARCIKISPNGFHLASGDRNGNVRVYDLKQLESIILIEAHESEVLYLQYSQPESGRLLLASSSRDRLIHIFDAKKNYELIQTIDDHSAAITATRFCYNQIEKQFYLISCGSDKSIIFRVAHEVPNENKNNNFYENSTKLQFTRSSYVCEKMTFYDMVVDPTKNYINTVSQDRIVRTYSIKDGKKLRQFNGSLNGDGYLLKMDIDRTGSLLATSCTDKCVYIWDLSTCECLAYFCGHSELIIDLKFSFDNKYLITIGVDSCIFVWNLNSLNTCNQSSILHSYSFSNSRKSSIYHIPSKAQSEDFTIDFLNENDRTTATTTFMNFKNKFESQSHTAFGTINENNEENSSTRNSGNSNNMRKSRAVWGPVCNTSFAVMTENENEDSPIEATKTNSFNFDSYVKKKNNNSSELSSLPIVQFPSPNVEKGLYTVVTVDPNIQKDKSLCLTIEEFSELPEDYTPTTPVMENQRSFCSPDKILNNDFNPSHSFNANDYDRTNNFDSLSQRRQSLSARYLMKTQQPPVETSPALLIKEQDTEMKDEEGLDQLLDKNQMNLSASKLTSNNIFSAQMTADLLKLKKSKTANYLQSTSLHFQHTESSLNKIKLKQQISADNSKLNKSNSMSSVLSDNINEISEKSLIPDEQSNNNNPPAKVITQFSDPNPINEKPSDQIEIQNNDINCLKKATSMVSLNCQTKQQSIPSSTSFNVRPVNTNNFNINRVNGVNQINKIISNTNNNNNSNLVILNVNQVINNNPLPPKTVRQVKQKSSDRNLISNPCTEKTSNLEKNHSRKLSNSSQNLQGSANLELQLVKKPQQQQRNSLYGKNPKQNRSNTEELLTFQTNSNEIIKEISPSSKTNGGKNSDILLTTKIENIQIDDESLWNEFYNNINDLVLLGKFQSEVNTQNLSQVQKRQRKELLTVFNKNTRSFIQQMEIVSEKKS